MITEEQAIHWLWDQYLAARTMSEIDYWFDRFAQNRNQQCRAGVT
jgi:hypothetical protein